MSIRIEYVPGAIGLGNPHTLPAGSPPIQAVVSAQIVHLPIGIGVPNDHTQAQVIAALIDHPVHAHDLLFKAGAAANAVTMAAASLRNATAGDLTVAGAGADGGVRNLAAAQAHVASAVPVVHGGMAPADPILNATPTRVSNTQFTLDQNTILGDVLTIVYNEVGERVLVS